MARQRTWRMAWVILTPARVVILVVPHADHVRQLRRQRRNHGKVLTNDFNHHAKKSWPRYLLPYHARAECVADVA